MSDELVNLFEHLIRSEDAWVVQVKRPGSTQAPYLQGAQLAEDGFSIEISNNAILDPPLSPMQVAGIGMHGFASPQGQDEPNYHRSFATDEMAREAAHVLVTVLESVLLFGGDDRLHIELFEADLTEMRAANPGLPLVD